jgi:hypothetical protein
MDESNMEVLPLISKSRFDTENVFLTTRPKILFMTELSYF